MFIVSLLKWWYTAGWQRRVRLVRERLASTLDYFSIDLLVKTLFAPFRQISAGRVDGPLAVRWRAFIDRLISRIIGAVVRIVMIFVGVVSLVFFSVIGGLSVVLWGVVPALPIVGVLMAFIGWVPAWT